MSDPKPAPYAGPQRVFSGMQPTNGLHLGNYLGALVKFVALQEQFDECMYCVVDLHAITENLPPDLKANTREVAATYLAAGVDPKRSIIFVQSAVPAHAELGWILQCVARMGWLERMTQFKDKSAGKNSERISAGLFTYPVLMAADILAYKATHVPVGDDQKQHLELARDIAQKFNNDFNAPNFFPQPEPLIQGPGARIMSLRDGAKKMSKSDPSDQSRINLTDNADAIANKLKRATTDPLPLPETEEGLKGRAEVENLVGIYAAMSGTSVAAVLSEWGGKGFGAFKPALADLVVARLAPIAGEVRQMLADPAQLDAILAEGAEKARALAAPVLQDVRRLVGFWG